MTRQQTGSSAPAHGLKLVISAAAVAATLGGWGILTTLNPAAAETDAQSAWLREQPPIPTLVPLVGMPASDVAAQAPAHGLRQVSSPPVTTRPAAVTFTRSSR
jgi:hypothetical protein